METLVQKAKKIRLVIFDVDGILTTGKLFYGNNGIELKAFHVYDGIGLKMLQQSGVTVAIITARQSEAVTKRMQDLKINHVYQGQSDKLIAYQELKQKLNLEDEQIAFVGDDLPDLPILRRTGLSITVPNAPVIMQEYTNLVTHTRGGYGAAREVCELIMRAQGTFQGLVDAYVQR
ncbi:MAG: HAD family hydrolase [Gammaproteobacteria bacterium]